MAGGQGRVRNGILSCPKTKLQKQEVFSLSITEHLEKNKALVEIKAGSDEVRAKQREDTAIVAKNFGTTE